MTLDEPEVRDEIEGHLEANGPIPRLHFVWIPPTATQTALRRLPGCFYHIGYRSWQRAAFKVAQRLHAEQPFDLAHQVTYCGYREPGYLWKLGIPFVWGPVGGTQNYPWRFLTQAGFRGAIGEGTRTVLNHLQLRLSPRIRHAIDRSSAFLTANSTIQRDFERVLGVQSIRQLDTGLPTTEVREVAKLEPPTRPFQLLWSGQIEPLKGLPLLVRALAKLPRDLSYSLTILGDGPQISACKRLARRLGVHSNIEWKGWVPYQQAVAQMASTDLFVFTSLRDTSGNVVLEALAAGTPVICLDHQGVYDMVTDECGIKIPVNRPRQVIGELAAVIARLSSRPDEREWLRRGAMARAQGYAWSTQGDRMSEIYQRVLKTQAKSAHSIAADIESRGNSETIDCEREEAFSS